MEAPEVPTEHLHEHLGHAAEHSGLRWINYVAVSTAVIAALAALASLLAGVHVNEAIVAKMDANDVWSQFGVKSIKGDLATFKGDEAKAKEYEEKKEKLQEQANELGAESRQHLAIHEQLARAVTFFQIAIAIAAISALTKRKSFWYMSLVFGLGGTFFLVTSLLSSSGPH